MMQRDCRVSERTRWARESDSPRSMNRCAKITARLAATSAKVCRIRFESVFESQFRTIIVYTFVAISSLFYASILSAQVPHECVPSHECESVKSYLQTAHDKQFSLRAGDEVWWMTSRNIKTQLRSLDEIPTLRYAADDGGQGHWEIRNANEFAFEHAANSDCTTIFYIHGNRTDPNWSLNRGIEVYRHIFCNCRKRKPVRLVIWHWPADQYPLPVQEFEDNARRAIIHGRHFARFMQFLDPSNPVRLMGYSLGSQFILSSSDQTTQFARQNCGNSQEWLDAEIRVAVLASVTCCQWPACPAQMNRAAEAIDRLVSFENKRDTALMFYQLKCKTENLQCLCGENALEPLRRGGTELDSVEVGNLVGHKHSIAKYVKPESIQSRIRQLFGLDENQN